MSAPVARSEQLKGAKFGAHEIVGLIGHGATASVFEAKHVALGKAVAVKILHEHLAENEQIASRFVREGRVAARLRHPNTVDILDVGIEQGIPYLVMELLRGTDLRSLLAETHLLTIEHALGLLLPILSAVAHAHDAGVVHRDLKPANIFLARDMRDDIVPKLVDFGLSKATGFDEAALTATAMVAGTVLYMAPEQTLGMKHASPASDQYSLAAILYECVTGAPPFAGGDDEGVYALIERIRTTVPKPPSMVNPRIPEAFEAVLLRALNRDPAKRHPSVRAFARALVPFAPPEVALPLQRDFAESAETKATSRPSLRRTRAISNTPPSNAPPSIASGSITPGSIAPASTTLAPRATSDAPTRLERQEKTEATGEPAPLPCAPGKSPFNIKGNPYRGIVLLIKKSLPGGLDAFCDALPDPRLRPFMRQPFLATGRYDILPFFPISFTLARLMGVPYDTFVRNTTAAQARYDAQNVYIRIFDGMTVNDIPTRIPRFNTNYYDFGEFSGAVVSPTSFYIEHRLIPAYIQPWYAPMSAAYTEECARLVGAKEAVGSATPPARGGSKNGIDLVTLRIDVRWK